MRRVVTGHDENGKSVVVSDDSPKRVAEFQHYPGCSISEIWATDRDPQLPLSEEDPTLDMDHFIPAIGETRFSINVIPPYAEIAELVERGEIDLGQFWVEYGDFYPDLSQTLEADGSHATDTIDYIIVLSGETWCELDDGVEVHLGPGDCLVQNGTRHNWYYRGSEPCVVACIMIGAQRE